MGVARDVRVTWVGALAFAAGCFAGCSSCRKSAMPPRPDGAAVVVSTDVAPAAGEVPLGPETEPNDSLATAQRLRLTVGAPSGTQSVTYTLDGQALGTVDSSPWVVWWPLQYGQHELVATAMLADGTTQTSAAVPFSVTSYAEPQSHTEGEGPP